MSLRLPAPIADFYRRRDWKPATFQRQTWEAFQRGESGLIHAPTGTGKTLAAWFGPLIAQLKAGDTTPQGLRILWITPMRALAADTEKALRESLDDLGLDWTVMRRTGDSSASQRARLRKTPPTALVTTPESLSLLLTYADFQPKLRQLDAVIVDEWHELVGSKRGVQLELCLARLRSLNPALQTWGMSATIGNLEEAAQVLLGPGQSPTIVVAKQKKRIDIEALVPDNMERFPWAGHLGLNLLPEVLERVENAGSTLIFTNTRSQAELWFEGMLKARPDWIGQFALHHASLSRTVRDKVEAGLKDGSLRCVVCTSSLDLGVDFSPVEQVLQIGSPKGIARLLQRAGRSGHSPGQPSKVLCVPTHAFELVEIAAARQAASEKTIESRRPMTLCLDVLVQHCVSIALGTGFSYDDLYREVTRSHAFEHLSREAWDWVLLFITRGGAALEHYPEYHRVVADERGYRVENRRVAQRHRMAIGTITSDSVMNLKWSSGGSLGTIEESFISRLKTNDGFLFNGRVLQLVRVKEMTAYVKLANKQTRIVPRWQGGKAPLSTELSDYTRRLLGLPEGIKAKELTAIAPILELQANWSALPTEEELLVEQVSTREGRHLFVFTFAGRAVNEGLAALLAWRLSQSQQITFRAWANDYGFELLTRGDFEQAEAALRQALSPDRLLDDLVASINSAETGKRQFREIAQVAGLVFTGYPGSGKSTRQIQASSGLIYDVLAKYDPDNLLVDQAMREVMRYQLEFGRLQDSLARIQSVRWVLTEPKRLTPLAFPLWAERIRAQTVSSEKWSVRLQRMLETLNKAADAPTRRRRRAR
ncbi:MAG: ligase-associated DNA damage response DEXH box helicase [Halieaceae bacterium]|jgi:ATP-dependent Lhr-like helicase|nr:ligase-associated DNA damage response DEXH box helicase [Halieaceae bacterium]